MTIMTHLQYLFNLLVNIFMKNPIRFIIVNVIIVLFINMIINFKFKKIIYILCCILALIIYNFSLKI